MCVDVAMRAPTFEVPRTSKVLDVSDVPTAMCETANTFVEWMLASTPRPPNTRRAPVFLDVAVVVSIIITLEPVTIFEVT